MKIIGSKLLAVVIILFTGIIYAYNLPQDQDKPEPWDIPDKYTSMENPYANDASLEKIGKMLYAKHCKSCHGADGIGDGSKAAELETYPGDFTSDEFKDQKDGVKYYKSFIGRSEMPNFEKKITDDEDRWALINYVKTLD